MRPSRGTAYAQQHGRLRLARLHAPPPNARGAPRARAARAVRGARLSGPHRRADPACRHRLLAVPHRRHGGRRTALGLGRVPRPAVRGRALRHPLRDQVVEARHELPRRLGRHAARERRHARRVLDGLLVRRLHDQHPARRPDRRQGVGGDRARGRAAAARARRPRAPPRSAPVLLEEREVGRRPADPRPRRARLLGAERLPHPRRPLEGRALLERLTPVEQRAPGQWQIATVARIELETPRVKSFTLELPMWMPHIPGQHYDVRLTAPDGYRAQRSFSIASSPLDEGEIELTIDRLEDGEVSPYFHHVVVEGDQVEVRGPFASYFVWRGEKPVLLVGGGSGVVPLMAILRHRRRTIPELPMRLVYSVRSAADVIYADELGDDAMLTFTREPPEGWTGHTGRIDRPLIEEANTGPGIAFVCGSNGFVEAATHLLLESGFDPKWIRT